MFFGEFCEIFKNTFFTEHLWTIASETSSVGKNSNFIILDQKAFLEAFE